MIASPRPPLLLVSNAPVPMGVADAGVAEDAPRLDYRELATALGDAPLSFPPPRRGLVATLEARTASDLRQAIGAFRRRHRYGAFVSFSEKVGLPLALLLRGEREGARTPQVLFAHHLTSERKRRLQARIGCLNRFDRIVVLCRAQERYLVEEAGIAPERVRFVYYPVDSAFWRRDDAAAEESEASPNVPPTVLSVGRERRDYRTLNRAARLLPDARFTIVASSPWARSGGKIIDGEESEQPEENVTIRQNLSYSELRGLYGRARAIVVPLQSGTTYAAGVNGVLEAMAMRHAPIVTRTPGIVDYVEDGVTGTLIPSADPAALANAVRTALDTDAALRNRGTRARTLAKNSRNLAAYVAQLAQIVEEVRRV